MNAKKYRTRTEIIERDNGKLDGVWDLAIDLGYSAVKLIAPNKVACFPSYAVRIDEEIQYLQGAPESSIMYRNNETSELWLVGEFAQNQMLTSSSDDSERVMYGRDRYGEPMFNVVMTTGFGIALMDNKYYSRANDHIIIQTGLPEGYLRDTPLLRDAMQGHYDFSIKVGNGAWTDFKFDIETSDVFVMSQPKGSLFSICTKNDGSMHEDVKKYLSSNAIIFDPGFGTYDLFIINNGAVVKGDTTQNLGMRRVFHETSQIIKEKYGVSIPVPAMQKYLETGKVRSIDRATLATKEYNFEEILRATSDKVCQEAISRMFKAVGGVEQIIDYNYLIVTGGTGAAWLPIIKEKLKNITTLSIIPANQNDGSLALLYSNVRGYRYYRFNKLLKEYKKAA